LLGYDQSVFNVCSMFCLFFGFFLSSSSSSFRLAANEIERLQREARDFARRKVEQEHDEELKSREG
jgi:hypothetical protein